MFNKDFISNLTTVFAITLYSLSLQDILTILVLGSAFILNIVTIIEKVKRKKNYIREKENKDI